MKSERSTANWGTGIFLIVAHLAAVAAFFFWSWPAVITAIILYWVAGSLGIGMGWHRLLTHRGYKVPKALEYFLATCGTLTLEGGPIFWVATHRVHHQQPLDEDRLALHQLADAERIERRPCVRRDLDTGADLAEAVRLLEHQRAEALFRQSDRGREAADAAAGDEDTRLAMHPTHATRRIPSAADGGNNLLLLGPGGLDSMKREENPVPCVCALWP